MKRIFTSIFLILVSFSSFSQLWVEMMKDPNANFYDTQAEFNNYWSTRDKTEKGKGYKAFRRWENFMEPRVYPKGDVKQASKAYEEFLKYTSAHPMEDLGERAANWVPMGPTGAPVGGGAGRANFIRFDPTNTNIVYTGSPAGGLWKSTNSGTSWTTNTDQLSVIGCTDVAIDPSNTNIMYLATGDGDAGDTYSIGVLKSTDGGTTWANSLSWTVTMGRTIRKLLINPTTPAIVMAATSNGIYRTTNSGSTWTQVQTGGFYDMEFKPGDPNTVYACGATTFYRSTDGGATWTNVTSGVPTTAGRLAIAVSPANTAYVYILACNNSNSGFLGCYRSTNSGTSFTTRSTTPNILGWDNGGDAGGQGWYDLTIAVSPTNADDVYTGGINIWRSTNGGTTFTLNSHWYGGFSKPYVHADIHDLVFLPGSGTTVWSANDGGVFRTTNSGTSYTDLSANLQIAQQYKIGLSTSSATILVTGHQDNGTNKLNGATWSEIYGGDGTDCFIDRTNNNTIYASYVYGDFQRSLNGGASWTNIVTGLTGNSGWVTPWCQDPVTANTLYAGYEDVFKSTNQGTSWTQLGNITSTNSMVAIDVAPSNVNYIYAVKSNAVYRSTNAGSTWTDVTGTLPVGSAALTNIEISPTDPQEIWVTFSGYSSANKVFTSTNGGTSWTNYTNTGLPNLPVNCIVYQNGSADGVYVGTDVGVYYRDNTFASWQPYLTGLPNVIVKDLEIYYATGKLRAATYGRGTWESDLFSAGASAPVADFTSDRQVICAGQTVNFTDISSYTPTSWSWTFTGGTPASSTLQNPSVVYNTPGTYAVTLVATNINGSDTETKTAYITVSTVQSLPVVEGFESATFAPTNWYVNDINGNSLTWARNATLGAYGSSSACAWFDNYNYDEAGARDELATAKYDFSAVTSATMTFDVAYARYNATYSDTLAVRVSTDCGQTFTTIWTKGGNTLSTNGGVDVPGPIFVPTSAQWRNENIDLSAYAGQPDVLIVFQNRGRYGQALYLDNINITGVSSGPVADFSASPTTVCAGQTVTFTNLSSGATSYAWTFAGGTPGTSTATNPTVTYSTPGTYNVTLVATNGSLNDTELKTGFIVVNGQPTAANAGVDQTVCVGSTVTMAGNTATTGTGTWTKISGPAGGTITTPGSPTTTITGLTAGTYVYQWTISNPPCTASSDQMTITVNAAPTTANAGVDQTVCAGTTVTMAGNTATTGTGTWTKVSGPAGGTITTPSSPTTTITALAAGTYVYQWTITNAPCTASSDQMTITVNGAPTTANAGTDQTVCIGSTATMAGNTATVGTGTWTQVSGPASTITTPSSPTTTITGLAATGTYVYQWTITNNPCTASSDQMTIIVNAAPTTANAGVDQTVCAGTTVTMAGNTATTGTGTWTKVSGPAGGTITTPSSPTTTITALAAGTYVYQWTITNAPCTASSDQMTITVNGAPTTANAGTDQTLCTGSTATMSGNTPTIGTGIWTQVSGPASTITTPTSPTTTITGLSVVGTYVYQWSITNAPCTASNDQITITVNNGPTTSNAGPDQTICVSAGTVTMAGNTPTTGTGLWTKISGPAGGTITTPSSPTTTITALAAGTYVYQWTISSAPCTASSDQMTITVNGAPTTANAGTDQTVCIGSTATMAGNTATVGTGIWTQVSGPASTITTPSSPTTTITGLAATGTYVYQWTITNNPCTASSDQMTIIVNAAPTTANAGVDQTVCAGTTVTMAGNTATTGTGTWTKVSGPAGGTITTPSSPTTTITALAAGTYVYQWTITNAPCTASSDQMTITVNGAPTTANAGTDQTICTSAGGVTMAGNTATVGTGTWTQVSGPASTITTPGSPTTTVTGMTTVGTYVYQWTITNNPCTASSDQMTVTVTAGPTIANAGPDQTICSTTTTVTMAGNTPSSGTGLWTKVSGPAGGAITTPSSPTTTITGLGVGVYTYQWTISGAPCPASIDQMVITVNAPPTTSNAGTDQVICVGSTATMSANTATIGSGAWTQVSGPSSTITTPGSPTTTITGLSVAGTYVYQWTITNAPCTASNDQVTITVTSAPSTANAGPDQTLCSTTTTATMSGNTPATGTGLWTKISGPAGGNITSATSPTTGITALGVGVYTYQWTITNGPCTASTDQMIITVNAPPTASNAGTDQTICGSTATLAGNTPTTGAGTWTFVSGPVTPVITTPSSPTSGITGMTGSGTYIFQWTINNAPCTASSDQVSVTVTAAPIASPSSNTPVCAGDTLELYTVTQPGATYFWDGPGTYTSTLEDPTRLNAVASMGGTYTLTVTIGSCSTTVSTSVTVASLPTANATNTSPVCEGNIFTITSPPAAGCSFAWTGPLGYTSSIRINNISGATVGMSGVYTITVTNNTTGCASQSSTTVTVTPGPGASATNNGPLCAGTTLNLSTPAVSGATYSWTGPGGFTSSLQSPTVTGTTSATSGTYTVSVSLSGCTSVSSTTVTVDDPPSASASNDGPMCEGGTLNLNTPAVAGATYSWTGPGGFTASTENPSITGVTAAESGIYIVDVTLGACIASSSTIVTIDPSPGADAGPDMTICEGETVTLNGAGTGTISWSPSTALSSTSVTNPDANPSSTITYTITLTSGTCVESDDMTIIVNPAPPVPTVTQVFDTLFASPSTGYTYQWYLDGIPITGATSSMYIFSANGNYTVEITDGSSCTAASDTTNVTTTNVGSIPNENPFLTIYPNPNDGNFTVTINTLFSDDCDVRVHDGLGQLVYSRPVTFDPKTRSFTLNLSGVARGSYVLTVTDGKYIYNQRLVID